MRHPATIWTSTLPRHSFLLICPALLIALLLSPGLLAAAENEVARGIVFHDMNGNGRYEPTEPPVPGVGVSNGRDIVSTNREGRYELSVDEDDIIFIIKPSGWRTPLNALKLPQFYYIHKPAGSPPAKFAGVAPTGPLPKAIDFPLYPQREPTQFRAILFGDPQPRDQKEVDYISHDVVEELIGTDASFGVTLGDIVFDDLAVFGPLNRAVALIGIPWYNIIGNHDTNQDAKSDRDSDETFESIYGPAYYSFDYGSVHFIAVDDIDWQPADGVRRAGYRAGLGKEQMEFIRNDLARIPAEQLVVLMMHIPLTEAHDRQDLYRLIEKRPFCISISGHTHHHEHRLITKEDGWMGPEPHHHIINVTVSGSWWSGAPDERGIPHTAMADGAPNGYSIISFDGTKYELNYKAAGRDRDYQMQIHAAEVVSQEELTKTPVFANVFNAFDKSTVEMRIGTGDWLPLQQAKEADPLYAATVAAEAAVLSKAPNWRALPKPKPSTHLWKANLPAGLTPGIHLIEVRATDVNGKPVHGQRSLRVTSASDQAAAKP